MGKLHDLSKQYRPPVEFQRLHWYEKVEITQIEHFLPPGQQVVIERMHQYTHELQSLPIDNRSYGVIHNDLHPHNFLYNGQRITMIDFEDNVQMWYIADLAISLFMVTVWPPEDLRRETFAQMFWPKFIQGYREETEIADEWLEKIPLFLKFRELDQYVAMYRACDMNNPPPWVVRFMDGRFERIKSDFPYLAIDNWLTR